MGLFHKLTFFDALEILDCDSLSAQQKKKIIKAESHFTEDEKSACYMLFCLHKGDCGSALYFINRTQQGEKLPGVMMAALYTHIAFRKFSEAHEEDPSYPDYIAYLALAYKHGFFCKKDHSKAVETAEPLRSSEATGALVKQALKDIFPEDADSAASDNKSADTPESEKAKAAAIADTESTSPVVPSAATVRQKEEVSLYLYPDTNTVLGKVLFSNGDIYTGEFYTDNAGRPILHGYGKMCYANGETWDGEWDNNLKASLGLHTFPDGKKQAEMTRMGLTYVKDMEREAVQKHLSKIAARTELRNQNAANYQTVTETPSAKAETKRIDFKGGSFYEGETRDGKMHGTGKYTWADGTYYEGEFADGNFNGFGKRVDSSGDVYEGQWKDDKRTGKGRITWSNGDTYEGDWKDGKRCGRGKLIQYGKSPSGETYMKYSYDGEWLDSKEHGHGICVEGDFGWEKMDKVFEGEWVKGKRQGRFVWYYTNSKGGRYINFYEDGNLIETCIPYDESIKTVEDIRRAKGKPSGASENLHHMNISNIPSWDSVKSGEYNDKVKKETEARRQYIRETVRRLRNPEENASPYYRNIENACMTLAPFMTEAENLFLKGEEEKALEIIEEMLDINIVTDDEWYYNSDTKYFSQFLSGALYSLASQIDFDTPDHDRFIVPAANIACYLWKKYGDYSLFGSVAFLWSATEKDQYGNFLWLKRMSDNGDYAVVSKYNEDSEYYFGHDLDIYKMGSDCELF